MNLYDSLFLNKDAVSLKAAIFKPAIIEAIKKNPLERFIASFPEENRDDVDVYLYADEFVPCMVKELDVDRGDSLEWTAYAEAWIEALTEVYPEHADTWLECWG